MLELVIFDADGVLFDSTESNIAYYNAIFESIGEPPLSPAEERACIFQSAGQVFEMRTGGDAAQIARMHEIGAALDHKPFFALLRPFIELGPFMAALKRRYRLGLATNRSATIPGLVHHLGLADMFDAIASARDGVRPKPAPDILQLCLERAGVDAPAAVYVGDSEVDRAAAAAAGTAFIGVGPQLKSGRRVERLSDLPAALEELAAG